MRLVALELEDFGLLARASLALGDGFTVCTGETGSGKTMLLGALGFVLGERSSADVVRTGRERARVTLAVDPDAALRARFADDGFTLDPGEHALLAREMTSAGKSSARINGRLATSSQLRAYGDALIEAIGQHEQQRLLDHAYQLELLDAYAGEAALAVRATIARAYERASSLTGELAALRDETGRAVAELEFARFAFTEIDDASVQPAEDERLRERREYLASGERIRGALAIAHAALAGADPSDGAVSGGSASDALGAAASAVGSIARYAPRFAALAETLAALQSDAAESALAIARELDGAEVDPGELETIAARLDRLERLKKKYGGTLETTLAARARFAQAIERDATRDEREAELQAAVVSTQDELAAAAADLSERRKAAAVELERRVAAELCELAMPAARFAVVLEPQAQPGPSGGERIAFALAPNPGEPARPLARAASGGELSRVLLALVVVLAAGRKRTALVFDEIDAGIGGATANAVGARLGALARTAQVLCVTHLAQIAAWADRHYTLRKRTRGGATVIELVALDQRDDVLEEIARMLSGNAAGVALDHAQALVRDARATKARLRLSA